MFFPSCRDTVIGMSEFPKDFVSRESVSVLHVSVTGVIGVTSPLHSLTWQPDQLESTQEPFYQMLGSKKNQKKHLFYETSHNIPRNELIKESVSWLDQYLGTVSQD